MRTAGLAAVIVTLIAGLALVAFQQSHKAKATAQREREQRQLAD